MKCYYEQLELKSNASSEDITKSYKRLALKYHPDKNVGNTEEASNKFLDIQKAYRVLKDPHERAWYDRNKDAIEVEELSGNFVNPSSFHNTYVFKNYDDNLDGFYTIYRNLFQTIVSEELLFDKTKSEDDYPVFGYSDSDFESVVKPFYLRWFIFQTKKTFSWTDEISESEGSNRQEMRYIKKLNSRTRFLQIKQYNESVRSLVLFLKKRDKRIPKKPPAPEPTNPLKNPATNIRRAPIDIDWDAHYRNVLGGDISEVNKRIEEFAEGSHKKKSNHDFEGINEEQMQLTLNQHSGFVFTDDSDETIVRFIKCILCDKDFKSLAMFLSHIKSKKHLANLKACERAKKREKYINSNFFTPPSSEVDFSAVNLDEVNLDEFKMEDIRVSSSEEHQDDNLNNIEKTSDEINYDKQKIELQQSFEQMKINQPMNDIYLNDIYLNATVTSTIETSTVETSTFEDEGQFITKEDLNKAKRKNKPAKKKKPSQQSPTIYTKKVADVNLDGDETFNEFECKVCGQKYLSNSKLFKHIKEKGHAAPKTANGQKTNKKSKKI